MTIIVYQPKASMKTASLGLTVKGAKTGDEEFVHLRKVKGARGQPCPNWTTIPGSLHRRKPGDFIYSTGDMCCNEKVWEKIGPHLTKDADGLSISVKDSLYYIVNVFFKDDIIDAENSMAVRLPDGQIHSIMHPAFHQERLNGVYLFRTPEMRSTIYCTDLFVDLYNSLGLKDLEFVDPISPIAELANWAGVNLGQNPTVKHVKSGQ